MSPATIAAALRRGAGVGGLGPAQRTERAMLPTALRPPSVRDRLLATLTLTFCAAWTLVILGPVVDIRIDTGADDEVLLAAAPAVLLVAALLSRPRSPRWLTFAAAYTLLLVAAILGVPRAQTNMLVAVVPIGVIVAAAFVSKRDVLVVTGVALIGATQFSIKAFTGVPAAPIADLLLGATWVALVYGWLTGTRRPPRWMTAGLGLLAAYLAASVLSAMLTENFSQGIYGFRISCWYMTLAVLVAFLFDDARRREQLLTALLLVGAAVGAYTAIRYALGPAGPEQDAVNSENPYIQNEFGELRLFGSLPGPQALAVFCTVTLGAGLAAAMCPLAPRLRILGLFGAGCAAAGLVGADVRSGMVASAAGAAVVIALVAVAPAFRGRRIVPLALALLTVGLAGGAFAASKLSEESQSGERFRNIFRPLEDLSIQERLVKWETVLADLRGHPFGHGLGATGAAESRYGRFSTIASYNPDSAYVKVAYDQGYPVLVLFLAALVVLLVGLGSIAIRAPGIQDAATAVVAAGAFAGFCVVLLAGMYHEGQWNSFVWALVGLGLAPLVHREPAR